MDSKKSVFDCAWAFGTLMTQASQSASGNADWKCRWRMSDLGIECGFMESYRWAVVFVAALCR